MPRPANVISPRSSTSARARSGKGKSVGGDENRAEEQQPHSKQRQRKAQKDSGTRLRARIASGRRRRRTAVPPCERPLPRGSCAPVSSRRASCEPELRPLAPHWSRALAWSAETLLPEPAPVFGQPARPRRAEAALPAAGQEPGRELASSRQPAAAVPAAAAVAEVSRRVRSQARRRPLGEHRAGRSAQDRANAQPEQHERP